MGTLLLAPHRILPIHVSPSIPHPPTIHTFHHHQRDNTNFLIRTAQRFHRLVWLRNHYNRCIVSGTAHTIRLHCYSPVLCVGCVVGGAGSGWGDPMEAALWACAEVYDVWATQCCDTKRQELLRTHEECGNTLGAHTRSASRCSCKAFA
eukprot:PhF_6_TR37456/c0_g1_i1/m.55104